VSSRFSGTDLAVFLLLLTGFSALALAYWLLTFHWLGVLLPIGFVGGVLLQRSDSGS
jgi:hypothetical protein